MSRNVALKIAAGAVALAAFGFAGSAMAVTLPNPWANDGGEVDLNIVVGAIGEVYSDIGTSQDRPPNNPPVQLIITNAGGTIPAGGIAVDAIHHLANVNYQVSADISGNIPDWTRFHVLVGVTNRGAYNSVFAGLPGQTDVTAAQVITWRRDGGGYIGNQPNTPYFAVSGIASTSATSTLVDYAADSIFGLPPTNAGAPITVTWTIATNP